MTWDEYADTWSGLHGGFDPRTASPVVRGWVRLAYRCGTLLTRLRVGPTTVTFAGLVLCLAVPFAATLGRTGLILAAVLVLLAAFADSFDGAVAVISGRISRTGFVADSVADRLGEAAWLTAFWLAGVPAWLALACGAASWLHEYLRARAIAAGMSEIGAVTVAERPMRVSVAFSGLLVGGVAELVHGGWGVVVLDVAAAVWLLLGVIGFGQLTVAVRRALA